MPPRPTLIDPELGPLTDDWLTGGLRVWQRAKGHRFSSDDVATAFVAAHEAPSAKRVLDLGCGLGSVLLTLAWKLPEATLVGIEAQAMSFELCRRNVERNDLGARVSIHHGDLREPAMRERLGAGFELVTGTPPYFPPGSAVGADDEQRAYARIEYRGGVEAYVEAARALLAESGSFVMCGDARAEPRVERAAAEAGLALVACSEGIARDGEAPLFSVWTLRHEARGEMRRERLVLRDAGGERTTDADRLRAFCGFPVNL
jgi:tRNA1Val (adenine37-N6)-methyltransferase